MIHDFFSKISLLLLLCLPVFADAQQSRLWGVTSVDGENGYGTVFHLNTDGTGFTKVHDFSGDHGYPFASLTYGDGKLWGMTMGRTGTPTSREQAGHGAIFTLETDGSGFKNLHAFIGSDGSMPLGELIEHGDRIWGMTYQGGKHNQGVIFSIKPDGTAFRKEHDFDKASGAMPRNSLLVYRGKFWGTTSRGGDNNMGVIFNLNLDGTGYKKVYDFERTNGGEPESGLTLYRGKFWGMTARGAAHNEGSLFSINTDGSRFTKHHDFIYPTLGDLIVSNDKLWGMMSLRGDHNAGVIFTMDAIGYKAVHHFKKANGRFPEGNLVESAGQLWGMTRFGGANDTGVLFSIGKDGTGFRKALDFDKSTGGTPYGTLIEVPVSN
ncbi:MAG: hypothetical protein Roseis3KO_04160 [Roseivirga sp.]